jgi:hypothetical protein
VCLAGESAKDFWVDQALWPGLDWIYQMKKREIPVVSFLYICIKNELIEPPETTDYDEAVPMASEKFDDAEPRQSFH